MSDRSSTTRKVSRDVARACVFCAGKPSGKNKEHVVPRWLIELTGNPSRIVPLAFDWSLLQPKRFAFDQYVAPACQSCNEEHSALELQAKAIVQKLLARAPVAGPELSTLLSWLDKVRVGVWRLNNVIAAGALAVNPTFAIKARMDRADRLSFVCPIIGASTGLTLLGTSYALFYFMPTCFGLRINDIAILNVSKTALLGARAGFPWVEPQHISGNGEEMVKVVRGTDALSFPLTGLSSLNGFMLKHGGQLLAQWALKDLSFADDLMTGWVAARTEREGLSLPIVGSVKEGDFLRAHDSVQVVTSEPATLAAFHRLVIATQLELGESARAADGTRPPKIEAACRLARGALAELDG